MPTKTKAKYKKKLRHNEYYDIQNVFDDLYMKSNKNQNFNKLYEIITSEKNILLAYRNIKSNRGSKTKGSNGKSILDLQGSDNDRVISYVRRRLENYKPHSVRRKYIPKKNGKLRPLGIPTIEDRLIQQCFLQVLEPIVEAKFHNDSYGFRPNRSTSNAIAKSYYYMNNCKCHYVVDVDIKGFFDNVNHGKLLKQLWNLGIRDKRVISIISKMLKAEVEGHGVPSKGTPQGGILSPLLANVVLNELDWWIDSQWLGFDANQITNHRRITDKPYKNTSNRLLALRRTNLKPVFIVRYADDFKLFTTSYENAVKLYNATTDWLDKRLGLEISPDKSKIVNLKTSYSDFLGVKFKVHEKVKDGVPKFVVKSRIQKKEVVRIKEEIKKKVFEVEDDNTPNSMYKLNALILGCHNYYKMVTNVNRNFNDIEHEVYNLIRFRWRRLAKGRGTFSDTFKKYYGKFKHRRQFFVHGIALYPISGCRFEIPTIYNKRINCYTDEGRKLIHKGIEYSTKNKLIHIMSNPVPNRSVEYNDNRISLFSAQKGRCGITGLSLTPSNMHCHHKIPRSMNGTDEYNNLIFLIDDIHLLIHSNKLSTQNRILTKYFIDPSELKKINKLRKLVGNFNISECRLITTIKI